MTEAPTGALTDTEIDLIDAWWRAANYLTVGQIYLQANPLLHEPLEPGHIKPRLLGHCGTSPGLNLLYAHLNRLIVRDDLEDIAAVATECTVRGLLRRLQRFGHGVSRSSTEPHRSAENP